MAYADVRLCLDAKFVDDPVHPKHVPGIGFGHVFLGFGGNHTSQGDDLVHGRHADLAGIDEGVFFQGDADVALRPAGARLAVMERWVVPIFTFLWACGQVVVAALTIACLFSSR